MVNMKTLIRIVFIIFIANEIDYLGRVCDDCYDCCDCCEGKDEEINKNEEIKEEGNVTAESLVNEVWYHPKKENLVLMIFEKNNNDVFTSKGIGDKISFKLDENDNSKIAYQNEAGHPLKLGNKKYALFEIKAQEGGNTIYLYCSDVESSLISVIACDTEKVENMACMFYKCSSLENLNLNNFNTSNVTNMAQMFYDCKNLTELEFGENFNTSKVTDMSNSKILIPQRLRI